MFEDDQSREIFLARLMYEVTGEKENIDRMIAKWVPEFCDLDKRKQEFFNKVKAEAENKNIIIYGAAQHGVDALNLLKGIQIECFCDNNRLLQQKGVSGYSVISSDELFKKYKDNCLVIIAVMSPYEEVNSLLINNGIQKDHIVAAPGMYEGWRNCKKQYFEPNIINLSEEIFVDGGCLNCYTILELMRNCSNVKKVYAFEPDKLNYEVCKNNTIRYNIPNVELINRGLWDETKVLSFYETGDGISSISVQGNCEIEVSSLDEVLKGEKITFIKFDIEGAELEALKGASSSIKKWKPKLAISVYHKTEDIIEIPKLIKYLNEDYRLYLRHYSGDTSETVLYAI